MFTRTYTQILSDIFPFFSKTDASADALATAAAAAAAATVPDPMAMPSLPKVSTTKKEAKKTKAKAAKAKKIAENPVAAAEADVMKAKPIRTKKDNTKNDKQQIQYNPDISMSKEQLTAWRREMRRVRNRESAAASRAKVRDRITELETEVDVWKKRYQAALERMGPDAANQFEAEEEQRAAEAEEQATAKV